MFDIGWSEMMVVAVVAIIVVGPKDLPRLLRTVGGYVTKVRRLAGDFQKQLNEAMREAELEDVRKEVQQIGRDVDSGLRLPPKPSGVPIKVVTSSTAAFPTVAPTSAAEGSALPVAENLPPPPVEPPARPTEAITEPSRPGSEPERPDQPGPAGPSRIELAGADRR